MIYSTPAEKQVLAEMVIQHGSSDKSSWTAPLKLLNKYYTAAWNAQQGIRPEQANADPVKYQPVTRVSFSPNILGKETNSPRDNGTMGFKWYGNSTMVTYGDGFGGMFSLIAASAPETLDDFDQNVDYSVLFSTKTVAEARGSNIAVVPVPISGFDTYSATVTTPAGGTMNLPFGCGATGTYMKSYVTGDMNEGQNGNITVTPISTTEFDNWLVLDLAQFYCRKRGNQSPRLPVSNPKQYRPRVYLKSSGRGTFTASEKNYNSTGVISSSLKWLTYAPGYFKSQGLEQLTMPETGNSYDNDRYGYGCGVSSDWMICEDFAGSNEPIAMGNNGRNTPWISGYYNSLRYRVVTDNDNFNVRHLFKRYQNKLELYYYPYCYIDGEPTTDYLRECYGAQQLAFISSATKTFRPTQSDVGKFVSIGSGEMADDIPGYYRIDEWLNSNKYNNFYLAFPDEKSIIEFFADWGILGTTDPAEALNGENANAENDVPGNGWWGPWDPDSNGGNPWDNPANPESDKSPVPYDPIAPGVNPLDPITPGVSTATGSTSFVLTQPQILEIENWLMSEDFVTNASSLFVDKMSAVNSLTLFPFDIVTHDVSHLDIETNISIATVPHTVSSGVYVIKSGYNTWIKGGSITFGDNWLALRGDFSAFRNSSYSCFIPFVGMVDVPASSVIYRKLQLDYCVDMVSGAGTAVLRSYPAGNVYDYNRVQDAGYIVAMYPCQIGLPVPLVSNNSAQRSYAVMMGTISGAINGASGGYSRGTNAASALNKATSVPDVTSGAGFAPKAAGAGMGLASSALGVGLSVIGAGIGAVKGHIDASIANPLEFSHVGSMGPMSSWTLGFTPYLTVTSQIPAYPANYEYVMGQQSSQRGYLSKFSNNGYNYVECYATKLEIPGATSSELALIQTSLQKGVFI